MSSITFRSEFVSFSFGFGGLATEVGVILVRVCWVVWMLDGVDKGVGSFCSCFVSVLDGGGSLEGGGGVAAFSFSSFSFSFGFGLGVGVSWLGFEGGCVWDSVLVSSLSVSFVFVSASWVCWTSDSMGLGFVRFVTWRNCQLFRLMKSRV